jgi:hypothetical protein
MEASALIGSLGGIGSIAKEVFGDNSDSDDTNQRPAVRTARTTPRSGKPS